MTFDAETGIVYDTLFYGILFFNFERTRDHFETTYSVHDGDFDCFFELKRSVPNPASELYSFFYCNWSNPSFMTTHFISCYKFALDSFAEYIKRIKDYKNEFKNALFSHFLEIDTNALIESSNEQIADEILKRNFDDNNLTVSLLRSLFSYDAVFDSFCSFIRTTYKYVKKFHFKKSKEIKKLVERYSTEKFIDKVATLSKIHPSPILINDKMSICLLNYLVIMHSENPETGNCYIFGQRFEDFIINHLDYYKINPRILCETLGHPVKLAILEKLMEDEFTATQLSDILFSSRQAVNAHLLLMLDYMFIEISRRNKAEIYYRVNPDFFQAAKSILFKFASKFTKLEGDERSETSGYY